MSESLLLSIVIIITLGIASQWVAWRFQLPAIVVMSITGLLIGPVLGIINPKEILGDIFSPLISLSVAIILFEGSLSLDTRELRGLSKPVFRIVTFGACIAWIAGSLAAHYVAGLDWAISFIIGGLFIVTGPTVIIPLLRQAKLKSRTAAVLKWEGIIVDPFGALLAVFAFQIVNFLTKENMQVNTLMYFFAGSLFAIVLGYGFRILISYMILKGKIPEYLKSPILFVAVLLCFGISDEVMHETGMLAVTVMGVTLARMKKYISSIGDIRHFNENISVLLTSTVFIILTASLPRTTIIEIFSWPIISFVLIMLFVVRPLSIWLSTIGTELTIPERALVGWIAPRGIVALTVSSYFATELLGEGYEDASILTTLTFALVITTVCVHGFSISFLAKKLGLANTQPPGILISGANKFSIAFGTHCKEMGIPILIVDISEEHLKYAKEKDLETYNGQILSEQLQFDIDMNRFEYIMAVTDTDSYNVLVANTYVPQFGYHNTFLLPVHDMEKIAQERISLSKKAHLLFGKGEVYEELNRKIEVGYKFKIIRVEKEQKINKQEQRTGDVLVFVRHLDGSLTFSTLYEYLTVTLGDELIVLTKE
ncbi:sodium:proton antiporter [Bacillus thuringiensis]|uniref:cation:proton antiporter n=1 Tax=Bacillus thuringiensis TaxID=1428 RepID=UPI002FBD8C18